MDSSPDSSSNSSIDTPDLIPETPGLAVRDRAGLRCQYVINYAASRVRAAVMARHDLVELHPALEDDYVNPEVERTLSDRNMRTWWAVNVGYEIVSLEAFIYIQKLGQY